MPCGTTRTSSPIRRNKTPSSSIFSGPVTSIDMAIYVISRRRLGVPQESRDAFTRL